MAKFQVILTRRHDLNFYSLNRVSISRRNQNQPKKKSSLTPNLEKCHDRTQTSLAKKINNTRKMKRGSTTIHFKLHSHPRFLNSNHHQSLLPNFFWQQSFVLNDKVLHIVALQQYFVFPIFFLGVLVMFC